MSDLAKWGLLVAGAIAVVILILSLPIVSGLDANLLFNGIQQLVYYCSDAFRFGRALVNNFLVPEARPILTGLMIWLICKWVLMIGIKIATWVYHYIFK